MENPQTPYSPRGLNYQRKSDISEKYEAPARKPLRTPRSSNGTTSTMNSYSTTGRQSYRTGRESNATHLTSNSDEMKEEEQEPQPPYYSKKMVTVGDGGCGKTCLLITYHKGYFPEKYVPTVFENYIHHPRPSDGNTMELGLWDTAGQEEYDRLRPLSYPQTNLILVCFAIDCPNSLDNVIDKWYPEVTHFCPESPLFLVGLKADLRHKRTCIELLKTQGLTPVSEEQGKAVARRMKAKYMECSSKEFSGVEELFQAAVETMVAADPRNMRQESRDGPGPLVGMSKKKKKRSCKIL